jgi:Cu-Zn family superoxide dismutase
VSVGPQRQDVPVSEIDTAAGGRRMVRSVLRGGASCKLQHPKGVFSVYFSPAFQFTVEEIPMPYNKLTLLPALLCATAVLGQGAPKSAHADIVNAQDQKIGTAKILAAKEGIKIEANVSQLPPGKHGIHIHAVGKCEGPDFTSAGPHLNPYTKKHGKDNPEGSHAGDLLNIEAGADGTAKATLLDTMVTLGDGPNSVFHDGGTAIVIHAKEDDYKTDPAGNSGPRIACGIIQK